MTYSECMDYFYSQLPMFHRTGAAALKADLGNITRLCGHLGDPQGNFPSVHIAGTNGKGSCSHMLAAILQTAGYKTGLYTSPHIRDFRERIRINGQKINKQEVVQFVTGNQQLLDQVQPSFFELTVALAFHHFAKHQVEIAIIEVGLGGRLDSTNIIEPLACLITNIGIDHSDLLGDTIELIAAEKAGIMKQGVPVIIGERQPETEQVFITQAQTVGAKICYAQEKYKIRQHSGLIDILENGKQKWKDVALQLKGPYQLLNIPGVLQILDVLREQGYQIPSQAVQTGLQEVVTLTGITGRWQQLSVNPIVLCDTGHNRAAFEYTVRALKRMDKKQLHMVLGFVNDKDIRSMLEVLPKNANYYFCAAGVPRSLPAKELAQMAASYGLRGTIHSDPNDALTVASGLAHADDLIFIGGSTFVVAELNELQT